MNKQDCCPHAVEHKSIEDRKRDEIFFGAIIGFVLSFLSSTCLYGIQQFWVSYEAGLQQKSIRSNYIESLTADGSQNLVILQQNEREMNRQNRNDFIISGFISNSVRDFQVNYYLLFTIKDMAVRKLISTYCSNVDKFEHRKKQEDDDFRLSKSALHEHVRQTETFLALMEYSKLHNYDFDFTKEQFNLWLGSTAGYKRIPGVN
jgi:hypothetical protein